MDARALVLAADENLLVTWARLGRGAGFDTLHEDGLTLTASGLPMAFFNGAFARPGARPGDEVIARAAAFFGPRHVPWLLWLRSGADPELSAACVQVGWSDVGGPPAMVLPSIPARPPRDAPAGLVVRPAAGEEDLASNRALLTAGFGMPPSVAERVVGPALLDDPDVVVLNGWFGDEPVSCSLASITGDVIGVYNVATPPALQGRGFGEALTWAAVMAGAERGATSAVLQASTQGQPVYERMGFEVVGRYEQWEGVAG